MHQEIVKIDCVVLKQKLLVFRIDLGKNFVVGSSRMSLHHFRGNDPILELANALGYFVEVQVSHRNLCGFNRVLHRLFRIVHIEDREVFSNPYHSAIPT